MIVGRGRPKSCNVAAVLLDHVIGIHAVAKRLVHCPALTVNNPTVRQDSLIGCALTLSTNCGQQRCLEPASVLVATLQIYVGGPMQLGTLLKHCDMGGAGVKPAVQRVGFAAELLAAALAGIISGHQIFYGQIPPGVGALLAKYLGNLCNGCVVTDDLSAIFAIEYGNGQSPLTLTGDAPVGTVTHHLCHTLTAP